MSAAIVVAQPSVVLELKSFLPERCLSGLVPDVLAVPAAVAPVEPPAEFLPSVLDRVDAVALDTLDGAAAEEYLECSAADGVATVLPDVSRQKPTSPSHRH